jgi:hypothetical protein
MLRFPIRQPGDGVDLGRNPGPLFSIGYVGIRDDDGSIWVGWYSYGRWHTLPLRLSVRNHSPTGFNWGYGGSGPAQLALALLCHATRNPALALQLYQQFKRAVVARLHQRRWHLSQRFVFRWIRQELEADGTLCQLRGNGRVEVV